MNNSAYSDKPRPGTGLILTMSSFLVLFLILVPALFTWEISPLIRGLILLALIFMILVLFYGFWMVENTSYRLDRSGIKIQSGLTRDHYHWREFSEIIHRPGLFTLKIGWRGITPCVRLRNGIQLKRKSSRFSLYLTPTDSEATLELIRQLEPRFTL